MSDEEPLDEQEAYELIKSTIALKSYQLDEVIEGAFKHWKQTQGTPEANNFAEVATKAVHNQLRVQSEATIYTFALAAIMMLIFARVDTGEIKKIDADRAKLAVEKMQDSMDEAVSKLIEDIDRVGDAEGLATVVNAIIEMNDISVAALLAALPMYRIALLRRMGVIGA